MGASRLDPWLDGAPSMSPGPTRVLQNVGDKPEGFIARVRSSLDAQVGHKLETEFARLETETCSCACKIMGLASHFLGATEIAKGNISSVRDRTTLSTSTAYLIPGRKHANGVTHASRKDFFTLISLAYVSVATNDSPPHPMRSTFSQGKVNSSWSAKVTTFLAIYTDPRVLQGKQFTITSWPPKLHPLSTGTSRCYGPISPWHSCFSRMAGSTTRRLTLNAPSRTRSTTRTVLLAHRCCKPGFGIDDTRLKR